jgi:hypothetical protein
VAGLVHYDFCSLTPNQYLKYFSCIEFKYLGEMANTQYSVYVIKHFCCVRLCYKTFKDVINS